MIANNGADLASKVASGGTVRLVVDHSEVSYYVDVQHAHHGSDFQEILGYVLAHGFVLMDEAECPFDETPDGFRIWACHKDGMEFDTPHVVAV